MGTCAFTGNWACDEIFFKNLCFHSPTQAQENIVSKISTLEGVFLKDAFLETVYTGNVRMVGQTGEKNFHFQTETDTCRRWDVKKRQLNGHKTNLHCGYKSWKKKKTSEVWKLLVYKTVYLDMWLKNSKGSYYSFFPKLFLSIFSFLFTTTEKKKHLKQISRFRIIKIYTWLRGGRRAINKGEKSHWDSEKNNPFLLFSFNSKLA